MEPATPLPRRPLGTSGIAMPPLALGSWHTFDRMDFGAAVKLVRRAVEAGAAMFDIGVYGTADTMPPPMTDVIFSAVIRASGLKREAFLVSEKLWLEVFDADRGFRPQMENALFRVGMDHADLVVLGDIRREDLALRDLAFSLGELHKAGLIRAWGVNNWSAANIAAVMDIAAAEGLPGPVVAQLKYSVARRAIPDGAPFAELFARGLALQASDVMEGGVLVKPTPPEREVGRDPGNIREKIAASAAPLAALAARFRATPAELCIAFAMSHPNAVNTLFGATRMAHLEQALSAVALLERIGRDALRDAVEPFWCDRGIVDPQGP
jgi:L-glyceraldehyde 3-phosphate reductase